MLWRTCLSLAACLVVVAVAPAPAPAQASSSAADTREVQAYRLTMPKLSQLNQAMADLARQQEADPAYQRLQGKKRELAALNEKDELSDAEQARMERLEEEIAAAEEAMEGPDEADQSLAGMSRRMERDPRVAGALRRANLAPREAATMQIALLQAVLVAGLLESGDLKEIPKDTNAENVRFVQANRAAINAMTLLRERED